ncbi:lysine histidine transporter-like 8 [Silene latifolia]|uniref:lysine histidine transporter-like 8 n=1 Tax=Silene latifolia TaxID=37657 RepID=UPI003D786D6C
MSEAREINSAPLTPRTGPTTPRTHPISAPPSQYHSPSLSRSPLLSFTDNDEPINGVDGHDKTPKTTSRPRTPSHFISPLASPLRKVLTPIASPLRRAMTPIASPLMNVLNMTKLDPQDAWLPITECRNGNALYAAFHTLCSGIGVQALVLPVAFTILGWTWGIICLTVAFIWQLYTLYLLVHLHESHETGLRYSRYISLCIAAFGEKVAKPIAMLPIIYLSAGTGVLLISIAGATCKILFQILCEPETCTARHLTLVEWYIVLTCAAVLISQLPNLNSIAGVSLIGAITAIGYITLIWVVSVVRHNVPGVSYAPVRSESGIKNVFTILNAFGIISFAFRGHNLILEIQATMPSCEKHPSRVPMWKGVKYAYVLVAMCLYPISIGGYWAYGNQIPRDWGMLTVLYKFHGRDTSKFILALSALFLIINALSSYQIYSMPIFDDMESKYTIRKKQPCPPWLRALLRVVHGCITFFFAVAFPFLASFAGLLGGVALPLTLAYPCFMWAIIKKPKVFGPSWWLNWGLGVLGMILSGLLIAAGIFVMIANGVEFSFFKPQ